MLTFHFKFFLTKIPYMWYTYTKEGDRVNIPNDPIILLSFINTKLRDQYGSLDELCDDMELNKNDLCEKLKSVGYAYAETQNQFK